jgi:ferredoxin
MSDPAQAFWLERRVLQRLLEALEVRGFRVAGPVACDGAVGFDAIQDVSELASGWRDVQLPGQYRLEPDERQRVFGVVNGPRGLKPYVFAPRERIVEVEIAGRQEGFEARVTLPDPPPLAILGVRPCDLAALAVQDRVFLHDRYPDPYYEARRRRLFLVAVSCTRASSSCFCTSMETGPGATTGFDLALTELEDGFVVRAGSDAGRDVLEALALPDASREALEHEGQAIEACAEGMERRLDTRDLPDALYASLLASRWDELGRRCLSCGNCTMVCPTCFCHDERDEPSLDGAHATRVREWDSCFNREHAQVHGYNFRPEIGHRYRQWLVHKLASWIDQFGMSGCVGCGRCITWCPVGIDLVEEATALQEAGDE